MKIGDTLNLTVIGTGQQSLPSPTGRYAETIHYEVYRDSVILNAPEMVLMTRDLFEAFVDEVRKARALNAALQPIERPDMHFATGANSQDEESR